MSAALFLISVAGEGGGTDVAGLASTLASFGGAVAVGEDCLGSGIVLYWFARRVSLESRGGVRTLLILTNFEFRGCFLHRSRRLSASKLAGMTVK